MHPKWNKIPTLLKSEEDATPVGAVELWSLEILGRSSPGSLDSLTQMVAPQWGKSAGRSLKSRSAETLGRRKWGKRISVRKVSPISVYDRWYGRRDTTSKKLKSERNSLKIEILLIFRNQIRILPNSYLYNQPCVKGYHQDVRDRISGKKNL